MVFPVAFLSANGNVSPGADGVFVAFQATTANNQRRNIQWGHAMGEGFRRMLALVWLVCLVAILAGTESLARQRVMYKGLTAGISTIDDTVRILGTPRSKVFAGDHLFCKYRQVDVKIDKKDKRVLAIIIRDDQFKDPNGIVLGDPYDKVARKVNAKPQGVTLYDAENGIVYVFNQEGMVDSIMYASPAGR